MRLLRHLFALLAHHSGHTPRVDQEQMASLQLYPPARRRVKAEPKSKEQR